MANVYSHLSFTIVVKLTVRTEQKRNLKGKTFGYPWTSSKGFIRDGSRIPRRRGRQPSRGGAPTYNFVKFSEKLHEIEKILDRGGGGGGLARRVWPP